VGTRNQAAKNIERLNSRLEELRTGRELIQVVQALMARDAARSIHHHHHIGPCHDELNTIGIDCDEHVRRLRQPPGAGVDTEVLFTIVGGPGVGKTALARKIYHELRSDFNQDMGACLQRHWEHDHLVR
jgi:Cdc6-like AAA superfamily ATPase